ncbi:MAG: hypothetical protein AUJ52_03680 [Elusimicrobia bacterium CG1_02_63_36]|nr:MAG: hypothetical protein AUJ52_03680 [Elusimicrobia bacterium CG1_02_63_36]PIP83430.1 MAG: hypothetical protein COR54_09885 [Elusimicrobia bacterium CG22_combo_CG10-13_8_21_14_all_63_91]PJA13493.1 MAG: hypothetical protein COX66_14835 [Elusimicrobia bacterium CG_4_10_14_0_2_um_filter_63_34]PJB25379.1 MAG: hypothetical protein CO113_09020 [Elusimicrobia bacterium CG_4_9_14_3_um_filter_62_55]
MKASVRETKSHPLRHQLLERGMFASQLRDDRHRSTPPSMRRRACSRLRRAFRHRALAERDARSKNIFEKKIFS